MPKRKPSVNSPVNKSNVRRKVEKDILQLLANQKRSCKSAVREIDGEIIISDDSSDFVILDRYGGNKKNVTEKVTTDVSKPADWVTALETLIQENYEETESFKGCNEESSQGKDLVVFTCREGNRDGSLESARSDSPELFDFETVPCSSTTQNSDSLILDSPTELSQTLNFQVEIDPFTICLPNDTTFDEHDAVCETAIVDKEQNVEIMECEMDLPFKHSISVSQKVPATVVLDGVQKQPTITSFFGGKSSKPTLTFVESNGIKKQSRITSFFGGKSLKPTLSFVEDPPKVSALKEKAVVKLTAADHKDVVEVVKTVASGPRTCPFYKKIPGTNFAVDAFSYGTIPGVEYYFLSHFHADHYQGLNKHFRKPIFCTQVTANLVALKLRVCKAYINVLPLNVATEIANVEVTPVDANHCPGAVMFIFYFPKTGQRILHSGDFRFHRRMTSNILCPALQDKIHQLFLDTTYLNPKYNFPLQEDTLEFVRNVVSKEASLKPKVLVVCGSYTIGKEKVFMAAAEILNCQVWTSPEKYRVMKCLEDPVLEKRLTQEPSKARVHVLPMQKLTNSQLRSYLDSFRTCFNRIVAFKPTGWSHSPGKEVGSITPSVLGDIHIYSVPYSEHSSFGELEQFVKFLRPNKVIPTVNVGRAASRNEMDLHIQKWLKAL